MYIGNQLITSYSNSVEHKIRDKNTPLGLFFRYIQTHVSGYFFFFIITVLVPTNAYLKKKCDFVMNFFQTMVLEKTPCFT